MGQRVQFGRLPFQRGVSLPHSKDGRQDKFTEQRSLELYNENPQIVKYCSTSGETENSKQVMALLSTPWSLSSSDIFQLLSLNSLSGCSKDGRLHESKVDQEEHQENTMLNLNEDIRQKVDQIRALLSGGNAHCTGSQKHKTVHTNGVGRVIARLRDELANILKRGCKRKRKEEARLQTAQMHAALSVARLAKAVAGVVGNCHFEPTNLRSISMTGVGNGSDMKMSTAIASAAALVATVCTEVAESIGATKVQVASVISMGLESRAPGDLFMLTTSTATCLKGVNALKLRAVSNYSLEDHKILKRGAKLCARTPDGRFQMRMVSVYHKYDNIILKLGKKHLHSAFTTYEEYRIFHEQGDTTDCKCPTDQHGKCAINLCTAGGAIQLLFEECNQYRVWKSSINYLLINKD